MPRFTVVGFYDDNMQGYLGHVTATSPMAAIDKVIATKPAGSLMVVAVFRGWRYDMCGKFLRTPLPLRVLKAQMREAGFL